MREVVGFGVRSKQLIRKVHKKTIDNVLAKLNLISNRKERLFAILLLLLLEIERVLIRPAPRLLGDDATSFRVTIP